MQSLLCGLPQHRFFPPSRQILFGLLFGLLTMLSAPAMADGGVPLNVPYVPTPQPVVERMLEIAGVGSQDVVYDLGSGDGRIVIAAAKLHGASGVGVDLDPQRVAEANGYARRARVADKVKFMVNDLFITDLSPASVVTLYLFESINRQLRPQLWKQLKVGSRVVSHQFHMGEEWPPEKVEKLGSSVIYYWTIREEHKQAVQQK